MVETGKAKGQEWHENVYALLSDSDAMDAVQCSPQLHQK